MSVTLHQRNGAGHLVRTSIRVRSTSRTITGLGTVILSALLLAGCGGSSSKHTDATSDSPAELGKLAKSLQQPIYWLGPQSGATYERTSSGPGRILIRYLPAGAKIGSTKPYLTIGTYALPGAYAAAVRAASEPGAVRLKISSSAVAFSTKAHPLNAWITYPGSRYQIEVFDPSPGRARRLVEAGRVQPVPGSPVENRPVAVSRAGLAKVAAAAKGAIYWAGPRPGQTYELTKTTQGGFLVRYLPAGTPVGAVAPQLTVGTYPVANALAAIRRLGRANGAHLITMAAGGLAAVNPHFPRSVYLAFPGSNEEVEVFDPSLAHARALVTSGKIVTVY
ncbi:MAG: hypothetical protein QOJ73_629 [Streptosporangiaceae bacterium]|nr:hypothetical protein [Streptosporangiaceae bacterium]